MSFVGIANYGIATASGLFQSVLGLTLLIVSNRLGRKATSYSLF
jgi:ABC-type polysaccharide transport system permease subunit